MIGALLGGVNLTRWLVWGAVVASAASVVWMHGYGRGERKLFEYQAEQARAAVPVVVKQGAITERVVTKYRDRVVKVKGDTVTLTKEIPVYVPANLDCTLPRGWWLLHDAAALGAVPPPAPRADDAAPGIAASQALKGVIGNYGACHATREQLLGLQEWVRQQYEAENQEPLSY